MQATCRHVLATLAMTALLAACGGGGGGSDDAAATAQTARATTSQLSVAALSFKTYHVRIDGGTAEQCTGLADAAYPGTGTGVACAWKSPMIALPPSGGPRIAGGDTLLIHQGEYMIGLGAPGAVGCSEHYPWDCSMAALPSGPDAAHPTRLLGEGHDSKCPAPPQLWGTQRVGHVLRMTGTSNAEVACLEITDHEACIEFHKGGMACERDHYPFGRWASSGIYANDSRNVRLADLNIHGLASRGMYAGRLTDWTVERVRIAGNGWVGWDGDLSGENNGKGSSNSGTLRFKNWRVEFNGCGETYPGNLPTGCWAQSAGGYGDGVGTAATGGDWIIEDSVFRHNTSDGLDLLYHTSGTVTLNRVKARGNAGNQIKVSGKAVITNALVVGNCGYFDGKPFTYHVDNCRAVGDAMALIANSGSDVIELTNNTIISGGNVAIVTRGPTGSVLKMRNNIMVGLPFFLSPEQQSADTYVDNVVAPGLKVDESHAVKQGLRNAACRTPETVCGEAGLMEDTPPLVNPRLKPTSPAIDSGLPVGDGVPARDLYGASRPKGAGVDRGAVESY